MLHVLLLILKITGIVIACILGLVIIVVAAVLFVPVRYKADADYHGKFKAHAKLSWLGILRVLVSYDEELAIKAKALFITIYSNNQKKEKTSKHRTSKKKKTKHSEENIFSVNDDEAKKLTENEKKPQIKMAEVVSDTKEDTQAVKKNVEDIKESAESLKETVSEDESKTTQNKNFFDKVKDKCFVIYTKIKEIINLVKDTVKKVSGEGADELFGGYVIYHEPVSLRPFKVLPAGLKKKIKEKLEDNKKNFKGKNYLIRGCTPIEERFIGNAYLFHPKEKAKVLKSSIPAEDPKTLTAACYQKTRKLDEQKLKRANTEICESLK